MSNKKIIDPNYFSWWRFSLYKDCPKRYQLLTMGTQAVWDGSQQADKRSALEGSIVHSVMEKIGKRKLAGTKETISVKSAFDEFLYNNSVVLRETDSRELMYNSCVAMVSKTIELVKQRNMMEGLAFVELPLKAEIEGLKLGGRIDWIQRLKSGYSVSDWKVINSASSADIRQLIFYWLLLENCIDEKIRGIVGEAFFVLVKLDVPLKGLKKRSDKRIRSLIDEMHEMSENIANGEFAAKCSDFNCRYCNVREFCDEYEVKFPNEELFDLEGGWAF